MLSRLSYSLSNANEFAGREGKEEVHVARHPKKILFIKVDTTGIEKKKELGSYSSSSVTGCVSSRDQQ